MSQLLPPSSERNLPLAPAGQTAIILLLWAIVNTLLYRKHGIFIELEASKYIGQAEKLLQTGQFESGNFKYYFVQIALDWLGLRTQLGLTFVYGIQLLFNLLATLYFFRTVILLFDSRVLAFLTTLLLLLNLPYQEFNTYLQTESLFQSFTLLFSCYLIRIREFRASHFRVILPALCLLTITRPTGMLYIPATFLYLFLLNAAPKTWLFLVLPMLLFLFLLNAAMGSGGQWDFLRPFQEDHIICGVPTCVTCQTANGNGNSLPALFSWILHEPGHFLKLAALKSAAFWGIFRSYYSPLHNIFLMIGYYPFILIALLSHRFWPRSPKHYRSVRIFLISLLLLTWGTVLLTCDDWHNRFFLSISPLLLLLAAPLIRKLLNRNTAQELPYQDH